MTYSKSSNTENDLLKIQQHRERTYSKSDNTENDLLKIRQQERERDTDITLLWRLRASERDRDSTSYSQRLEG